MNWGELEEESGLLWAEGACYFLFYIPKKPLSCCHPAESEKEVRFVSEDVLFSSPSLSLFLSFSVSVCMCVCLEGEQRSTSGVIP